MKEYIRIVQTDSDEPEVHEDNTDVKSESLLSASVTTVKDSLKTKMVAKNYKFQKHICDHDEPNRKGCKLEDI